MKDYNINRWKDSASESLSQNEKRAKETGYFTFFVTTEQKEYLEKHTDEIDEWCEDERHFGENPIAIRFEDDWDGNETCYTCECYFDKWYENGYTL